MNKKFQFFIFLIATCFFISCSSGPSDDDIKKKLLLDYVCAETAKVNDLKIIKKEDAEAISGNKGYSYTVSGEVEWPTGCTQFGTQIASGLTEKFENKKVNLIKVDGDWK